MPYVVYKDKRFLARWPKSWDRAILKVAQRSIDEAASSEYCDKPYKCRDLKLSRCNYCYVGRLKKDGDGVVRHKSCEFKRSKISWRDAQREGKLEIIPLKYSLKDISTRYMQLRRAMSEEYLKKERIYKKDYFKNNYKNCKKSAKGSRDRRDDLFENLSPEDKAAYPVGSKKKRLPDTPENIRDRKSALEYKKKHYKRHVRLQCKRNKLKTALSRKFLEEILLLEIPGANIG